MKVNKIFWFLITILILGLLLSIPSNVDSSKPQDTQNPIQERPYWLARADLIIQVIAQLESNGGGDCHDAIGLSGERGCFQYLPSTWEAYSKEIFGYVIPLTPENAEDITRWKVYNWLKQGKSERDIFLIWNQGNDGPCKSGINSHGVKHDSW